jgi:hypothetical protein
MGLGHERGYQVGEEHAVYGYEHGDPDPDSDFDLDGEGKESHPGVPCDA